MTPEELKVYKKERLEMFVKGLRKVTGASEKPSPGGQSTGQFTSYIRLIHDDLGFDIKVDGSKSQLKNLKFAVAVFELYVEEFYP